MTEPTYPPERGAVQEAIRDFRARMALQDEKTMKELALRWLAVERRLQASFDLLVGEALELNRAGTTVGWSKLYEMERYRNLLGQAHDEVQRYERWATGEIMDGQRKMLGMGIEATQEIIRASYAEAGVVAARFDLLPVEAVEAMIGYAGDGTQLFEILMRAYPGSIQDITELLIENTAMGINPRKTARLMARKMSGNLQKALVTSRTEQVRAFRTAGREQAKASGVVEGWIWRCALQRRTCMACLAKDGTRHEMDDELNDHPEGRCFQQWIIQGLEPVQVKNGREWFVGQPPEVQQRMMGAAKWEAWQEGKFEFEDLAAMRQSERWGDEIGVATLKELEG